MTETLRAILEGRAVSDLTGWRKVLASGPDAPGWLNDLLSADLARLADGEAMRSLLLSPRGRIRADITVTPMDEGLLLVQDPTQPDPIDDLLAPYILSSEVELEDMAGLVLLAYPGGSAPRLPGTGRYRPSATGPGEDLFAGATSGALARETSSGLVEIGPEDLEVWRVHRGAAKVGPDLGPSSLPQEAGLDDAIAYGKGCFLGQEAVARVRNLGHPPFVLLGARSEGPASVGDAVMSDGAEVGEVTSAAEIEPGRFAAIVRVRWEARDAELRAAGGASLVSVGRASGAH